MGSYQSSARVHQSRIRILLGYIFSVLDGFLLHQRRFHFRSWASGFGGSGPA